MGQNQEVGEARRDALFQASKMGEVMSDLTAACKNTDIELWREREGDYYCDSVHVTQSGGLGINHGGFVQVKSLAQWAEDSKELQRLQSRRCENCQHKMQNLFARDDWWCGKFAHKFPAEVEATGCTAFSPKPTEAQ